MPSRLQKFRQQIGEGGLANTLVQGVEKAGNGYAPPFVFRSRRLVLVVAEPNPQRIPSLNGVESGFLTPEQREKFSAIPELARFSGLLAGGSSCAIALTEGKACAMAWARIGPGDFVMDDNYRNGFRWQMQAGEAWVHNGEAFGSARGAGVYLTAYKRMMEEFLKRGVKQVYGQITVGNVDSERTHRRLGFREVATLHYVRVGGVGCYRWKTASGSGVNWTLKRSDTVCPGEFLSNTIIPTEIKPAFTR